MHDQIGGAPELAIPRFVERLGAEEMRVQDGDESHERHAPGGVEPGLPRVLGRRLRGMNGDGLRFLEVAEERGEPVGQRLFVFPFAGQRLGPETV